MFLPQSSLLGFTKGIAPVPVPNQVTARTGSFLPFTVGTNDWQGRAFPFKNALGQWGVCWVEGTAHSSGVAADQRLNIAFSNDEGATWTSNNTYIGGGAVSGFPLPAQAVGASFVNEVQVILCPNGELVIIAFDRTSSYTNVSWSQWRSTDHGVTWTFQFDFCNQLSGIIANNKVQAVYEHMISGTTIYLTMMEFDTSLDDTRIMLYKSEDNCNTYDFVSNPVEYDEANPDCTESSIGDLGNGKFFCVFRTQNLGNAVWKQSNDYGLTWGSLTDFSPMIGYVGVHQPKVKKFSNFFLLMGRDNKRAIGDTTSVTHNRTAYWTTTDLFATPAIRRYLDPYYSGSGSLASLDIGDSGYGRCLEKLDGAFVFFGYFGDNASARIYKYDVNHTNSPSTEKYSNTAFFPETITSNGIRLQMNRDNIYTNSVSPAIGGIVQAARVHNTLASGAIVFVNAGTLPELIIANDKGWLIFNSSRIELGNSFGNTLYRASFSLGVWLWPDDGQPAATQTILSDRSTTATTPVATTDRVQVLLLSTGVISVSYMINNVNAEARTASAVFTNGAQASPTHLAVTFTSGGIIRIYINGVLQTLDAGFTGDISALTMASYTTTVFGTIGQRVNGAGFDLPWIGMMSEFIIQTSTVWNTTQIGNLMLN